MHRSVSFNFELLPSHAATLPALASASIYGKGVFTTLAIHGREPFLWDKHWRRLRENAGQVGIDISDLPEDALKNALVELIKINDVDNGRARISFFDESSSDQWQFEATSKTSVLITTADFRPLSTSVRLAISRYKINSCSPLSGVKSSNYLEKLLALDEAKRHGFDECIQLNERDEVTSASMANIFWLRHGKLFTPALETGCLGGTTREFILESLQCEEVATSVDELRSADEIFLTSAGVGIAPVAEFDGQILSRHHHAILDLLPIQNQPAQKYTKPNG